MKQHITQYLKTLAMPGRRSTRKRQFAKRMLRMDLIEQLESRLPLAADVLRDINSSVFSSDPSNFVQVGSTTFFIANSLDRGRELWKTDGTEAGTALVRDIRVGNLGSDPKYLTNVNGTLYFSAFDMANGTELWRSDGTEAGTFIVRNIFAGNSSSRPEYLVNVNGTLFFRAVDSSGYELWKSDGTSHGTVQVKDIATGSASSQVRQLTNVNGTLYFQANDGINGVELWRSDGTDQGTVMVRNIAAGNSSSTPVSLTNFNGTLVFLANDGISGRELWKSDGTTSGTTIVRDVRVGSSGSYANGLTSVGSTLFFAANDGINGTELWKTDGTTLGTEMVRDIVPGSGNSNMNSLTNVSGTLYFRNDDTVNGSELWKSDGTSAGTVLVKNIAAGSASANPGNLTNVNGTLFFSANDGATGVELWKSDGTDSGTVRIRDIHLGASSSSPLSMTNVNGVAYFGANDGSFGGEVWKSDGSENGTVLVDDVFEGTANSNPRYLTNVNGTLFFTVNDGSNGEELWRSDGTTNGTVLVRDIRPGYGSSTPRNLTNVNGTLFFTATDSTAGTELWKSDGTANGTVRVRDILPGIASSSPRRLTSVGTMLFFTSSDGELWKSDGTESGTVQVRDIRAGAAASDPSHLTNVGGILFFIANDGSSGSELWKSDGTPGGTVRVRDIRAGADSSTPVTLSSYLTNVGGTLFLRANDGSSGEELWKSDGTENGTVMVRDIFSGPTSSGPAWLTEVNGTLFFQAFGNASLGGELWRSDGTTNGTTLVRDIRPGASSSSISNLTNVNGTLFFRANDGTQGYEVWKSDGTVPGTVLVKDLALGAAAGVSSPFADFFAVNDWLFFRANDGTRGDELWVTDGTDPGTVLVADLVPGLPGSRPTNGNAVTMQAGSFVYFTAFSRQHGDEVFRLTNSPPTDIQLSGTSVLEHSSVPTTVGILSTTDPNAFNLFRYELVAGAGSTGNDRFRIVGNRLQTAAQLDRELNATHSIRIRTTDHTGMTFEKSFVISVTNVNEAPTNITLSPDSIPENAANNTVVGSFATTDPDIGDTFTYALVSGAGSTDNAAFTIAGNQLLANSSFNFEDKTSYSIRVQSRDAGNLTFEKELTVTVVNVNETPTDITLSAQSIAENRPVGTALGTFSTSDPDTGNTFAYSLVSGDGASGNGQFTIVGNELRTNASFNFEGQPSYNIRVRSTDNGNLSFEKTFVITVTDVNDPPAITLTNVLNPLPENANTSNSIHVANISLADDDGGNNSLSLSWSGASAMQIVNGTQLHLRAGVVLNYEAVKSYVVVVQADDPSIPGTPDAETTYTLSVSNVNEAPTGIQSSNRSILENRPSGTLIGNLSAVDPDQNDSATFQLLNGQLDNSHFQIQGNQLQSARMFDAEEKWLYDVRIRVTDAGGLSIDRDLQINILGENEWPPVFASPSSYDHPENLTDVGVLNAPDPDKPVSTVFYSLVGGADQARFSLVGPLLRIVPAPNFEAPSSAAGTNVYQVVVRATDDLFNVDHTVTVTVTNANDLPTLPVISGNTIQENRPAGTVVGILSSSDEDGDTVSYSLASGTGSTDNSRFAIVGNQLRSSQSFDFENPSHRTMSVRVRAADGRGGFRDQTFTIDTQDINEPPQAFDSTWQLINGTRIQAFSIPASDPESLPLTYDITQPPRFGSLTGTGRERTYVANDGFFGTDELYFKVSDGVSWSSEKRLQFQMIATPPTVNFVTAAASWSESSGMVSIPVTLSPPAQVDFDLVYTLGGTATVFSDYEWPRLLITAGSSVAHIPVFLTNDATFEGQTPETLILTLGHATVGTPGFVSGTSNQFTLSIVDDETIPTVSFVESTVVRAELTAYEIKVLLSGPSIQDVVIPLVLSGAASSNDYALDTTQITIRAGNRTGSAWIGVVDDTIPEFAENVIITFGQLQNAVVASNTGSNPRMTLTIPANDRPTVSISSDQSTSEDFFQVPAGFAATLSEPLTHELRVPFVVTGTLVSPADYRITQVSSEVAVTEFVFPPLSTQARIAVRVVDDNTPELEERLNIRLAPNNAYRLGARSQASLVVQDNDTPRINLSGPDSVWESSGTVNLFASLSRPSPLPVEADVRFSSNNGSGLATFRQVNGDFFSSVTRIRFEPGQQVVPIPIRLTNDSNIEENEWFTVYLENPVNGLLGRRDAFSVTIQDDDIGITLPSVVHISESTRTHFFSLQLSSPPQRQVTVPFRITGTAQSGADYVLKSSSTVVIQPGQWSASIEFEIVDDNMAEDYEEIQLEVLTPVNATVVGRRKSTIYINDNEGTPIITFAPLGYVNGQPRYAFSVLEENLRQEVKIQLSHPSSRDVHVRVLRGLNATANVDYRLVGSNPGTENVFTIPAGSVETSFFVEVLSDNLREGSERLDLQLTRPTNARLSNAPVTIRGTILDNDSPPGSGLGLWQGTYAFARDQLTFNPNYAGLVTGSLALMTDTEVLDLFYQVSTLGVAQAQTVEPLLSYDPAAILAGALAIGANPFAGPIQGAALFFDTNRNGIRDFFDRNLNGLQDADESHELSGISTADGSTVISTDTPFALDSNSDGVVNSADGRWVSSGGIDTTTGLPRRTIFTAPFGQYALTPMSTLAEELTRRFGFTGAAAMSRVFSAFEVDEFDFSANNVLFSIISGDARAASVYIPHVQLDTTILLLGELFSAATNDSSSVATFGSVANASIASNVSEPESTLDLASATTIVSLIQQLAFETGTTLSESLVNTIADVVAAGNSLLSSYQLSNFQNGQAFAEQIMKTKKVLQGELSTALRDVARGLLAEQTFLNQFTGSALSTKVAAATINGVLPAAVVVSNAIVREGTNGGRQLEFILAASEGRTAPITIEYTTIDDSATVADGDYVATSGTLTWQPNDPQTKRVFVTIPGDTKFESDERVQLIITSVTNASVRRGEGYGYIINDDSYSVQTSLEQATNDLQLTIDDENGSLTQNDEPLFEGAFIDPMVLNLNGQATQNDRLTLDFSADVYRADTVQFQGGAGASDSLTISGGVFPTVEYTISGPDSSRLRLIPQSISDRSLVESLGVESVAVNAAQIGTLILRVPAGITALRIEDTDANTTGRMRVVSPTNAFAPLEFTNPTTKILVLQDNLVGTELTIGTLDSAFTPGAAGIEEARTGIYLSNNSINENSAGGSIIGSVTSREFGFDGSTFAVAFVSGGTSDNASFQLTPSRDLATGANTTLDFENRTSYTIRLQATSSTTGESIEVTATVQVNNLPELAAPVQIGHIANSNQRSIVRNVVVSFDSQVTIDSGAFMVEQRNLVNGAPVYTAVTTAFTQPVLSEGRWVVTLSFSGALTIATGHLVDGDYRLTIDASKVRLGGVALDGNRDGTAGGNYVLGENATDRFFALFGDTNGDGLVGIAEFGQFRSAFGKTSADPGYNALFDFDNNGAVGIADFGQFRSRFGKPRPPFN